MGLTGGLADVGSLYDALYGIHTRQVDPDVILDKYAEVRSKIWHDVVDKVSSDNIERLWHPSDEAIEADPFFAMVKKAETDIEFSKQLQHVCCPRVVPRTCADSCRAWMH